MAFNYANKIQALLGNVESLERQADTHTCDTCTAGTTNHREESRRAAANYRATADRLMREYQVAEEEALAQDIAAATPIKVDVLLSGIRGGMPRHWYGSIFGRIAMHCGVRYVIEYRNGDMFAVVVGYEGDVRYAQFLYTAAYLMFATRIDPVWDPSLAEAENIWRLRNAGIERRKIADLAWHNGHEAKARTKVQRIYLRECAVRGEEARAAGLGHQTSVYREAYAQSFVTTLATRLRMAREATDAAAGGLVLHGRSDRVDEAFYGHFPYMRPEPRTEVVVVVDTEGECERCAKNKSGHCRNHPALRWSQADERRYQSRTHSPSARAGQASGRTAAEGVAIRQTGSAARLDASGRAIEG